jgi:hypothetical protein
LPSVVLLLLTLKRIIQEDRMKEVSTMTVKEIFRPIMLNDNVAIIDQKIIINIGVVKEKIYQ